MGVIELALASALGCGFDARGLGGGVEPPLNANTVTTGEGATGSNTSAATEVAGMAETETSGAFTAESEDVATHASSGEDETSTGGTAGSDETTGTEDGTDAGSSGTGDGSSDGSGSSAATGSTGDPPCDEENPGLVFVSDARLVEYALLESDLLADFGDEAVPYARANDSAGVERMVGFPLSVTCPQRVYLWALVYTGAAVEPEFEVTVAGAVTSATMTWRYECGGIDRDWTWIPVGRTLDVCLDRPVAFDVDVGATEIRFTPPPEAVSVLAGLAYATDPGFAPDSLYTP